MKGKALIFSAPSGSGKTTLVRALLEKMPGQLAFSISATSRLPRGQEKHGVDYYFLSSEEFQQKIQEEALLEWEEVYAGTHYGTLKSEVDRLHTLGKTVLFDIDVVGGVNLKEYFGDEACSFFIQAPNKEVLAARLRGRGTENEEQIAKRLARADYEMGFKEKFDFVIINDDLDLALNEIENQVRAFLNS